MKKNFKRKLNKTIPALVLAVGLMAVLPSLSYAHCDTVDGPVIHDAKRALEENNINYILKWIPLDDEVEITNVFNEVVEVRDDSAEAKELADKYLFETLVRIHRASEGATFTGVKPEGYEMAAEIIAADKSIEVESLEPFEGVVSEEKIHELEDSFQKVLAAKDFDVNDVEAGREYVAAYVEFTHLAEGEHHEEEAHHEENEHEENIVEETQNNENKLLTYLPWTLTGVFLVTTILAHKKHSHK